MDLSVIICTYNRCAHLARTLESLCAVEVPEGLTWEVIVVDNNSSDATSEVCADFGQKLPLRRLLEAEQGLSAARNRAIGLAAGSLFLFTDDDVIVDRRWIASYWEAARRRPEVSFFGGRSLPWWEGTAPPWLKQHSSTLLFGPAVCYDLGSEDRVLGANDREFVGANMAFRREVFANGNGFRNELGRHGRDQIHSEETELQRRLMGQNAKGFYVSSSLVHHCNPKERMTEAYIRRWFAGAGMTHVRLGEHRADGPQWFGAPRYLWRNLVSGGARYVLTRWTRPASVWLRAEIDMASSWGAILEFRKIKSRKSPEGAS